MPISPRYTCITNKHWNTHYFSAFVPRLTISSALFCHLFSLISTSQPFLVAQSHHLASSRGGNSHRAPKSTKPDLQQLLGILMYGQGCLGSFQSYSPALPPLSSPTAFCSREVHSAVLATKRGLVRYTEQKLQKSHGLGTEE